MQRIRVIDSHTAGEPTRAVVDGAPGTLAYYAAMATELGYRKTLLDGESIELVPKRPRYVGQHVRTPILGAAVHINAFNFPAWGTFEKAAVFTKKRIIKSF